MNTQNTDIQLPESDRDNLIRKTIHLSELQLEKLKRLSRRFGVRDYTIEYYIMEKVLNDDNIYKVLFGDLNITDPAN